MSIAKHFQHYLQKHDVSYQVISHRPSETAIQSSHLAHVSARQLAKAVVLEQRNRQGFVMAVIPACNKLNLNWLNETLATKHHLLEENRLASIFIDCELGAVPPIGTLYHMRTVWDSALKTGGDLYLEAGDHRHLLRVASEDLSKLHPCGVFETISVLKDPYTSLMPNPSDYIYV